MRGNKAKHHHRSRLDDDDVAYEREYMQRTPPPPRPSCPTGKVPIETAGHAAAIAKRMRHVYADPYIEPYRCPECGYWHTGHAIGTNRLRADVVAMPRVSESIKMHRGRRRKS